MVEHRSSEPKVGGSSPPAISPTLLGLRIEVPGLCDVGVTSAQRKIGCPEEMCSLHLSRDKRGRTNDDEYCFFFWSIPSGALPQLVSFPKRVRQHKCDDATTAGVLRSFLRPHRIRGPRTLPGIQCHSHGPFAESHVPALSDHHEELACTLERDLCGGACRHYSRVCVNWNILFRGTIY
jgi:hypothetical protein